MPPQAISSWPGTATQTRQPAIPVALHSSPLTLLTEADKHWRSPWLRWKSAKINALGDLKALFVSAGPAVCVSAVG